MYRISFITEDSVEGDITNPLSLNLYTYCQNNPEKYVDPSGHFVETALDVGNTFYSAYQLYQEPSWANAGYLLWNGASVVVPFVPGSYSVKAIKNADKIAEGIKISNKLAFSGGKAGEQYLAKLVGGKSQVYFKPAGGGFKGGRYVDQLADGIAHESKVGYNTLTQSVRTQVLKDAQLIKEGQIEGATWHFFKSANTGKIGASKQLLDFLKQNGIKQFMIRGDENMDYPMMDPPFEVIVFEDMNKKEAKEHFEWYVSEIPNRIKLLKMAFEATGGGTETDLNFSPESLKVLWGWFQGHISFIEKSKEQIREELTRMPDWLQVSGGNTQKPSRDTLILAMDIAIYFGEVFVRNLLEISWGFVTKPKSLPHVNRPVLVGFSNTQMDPRMVILNSLKKNNPDTLYKLFQIWTEGI